MREKILMKLADWHSEHPWRMLLVVLLLTVFFAAFASQLSITMRTSDLLPSGDEKVIQFNRVVDEFSTATSLVVVVQGEELRIKEFADRIAPRILEAVDTSQNDKLQKDIEKVRKKIEKQRAKTNSGPKITELESEIKVLQTQMNKKLFNRVDYKAPVDFLKEHMLMLVEEDDLENLKDIFMDPNLPGLLRNINNSLEKEYVGKEESISTREKEDGAFSFLDGIQNLVLLMNKASSGIEISEEEIQRAADKLLFGEPYFLSYDKKALILNVVPNFTLMDRDYIMSGTRAAQAIVDDLLGDFFLDVDAGLSGAIPKEHDEQVYSEQSLGYTTVIAFVAILLLLIISFRMIMAPIFAIINLLVGVIWALGTASIIVGQLNRFTSTMSIIILGLGIDFSIHLISGFTERRAVGDTIADAVEWTFLKSGKGILTGAVTTAFAFFALIISRSRGMKEMGYVMGSGLLAILLATMLCLPIMLVLRERFRERRRTKKRDAKKIVYRDISFRFLGKTGQWLSRHYVITIFASIFLSGFLIWSAFSIEWDYDYENMEPKGLKSMDLMSTIMDKFDLSMDYALIIAEDIAESQELTEKYRDLSTVAVAEDISLYLPTPEQQNRRVPHISEVYENIGGADVKDSLLSSDIPTLQSEIERLEMNIIEMQDMAYLGGQDKVDNKCKEIVGDPENPDSPNIFRDLLEKLDYESTFSLEGLSRIQGYFAPYYKDTVMKICSTEPIHLEELPASIQDRYSNRTRELFLITAYPAGSIYDGEFLNRFADDVEGVSDKSTGTAPLFKALIRIFGQDGRNAILLTLCVVFILLWVDFKSPRFSLVAMIPLAMGAFWMVGLMNILSMKLSIMSMMGLPLIIGIGIDDGVHIMHRWRHEGQGKIMTVYSSTGKAILLTSLTTMLAFGSLMFSAFPAWGQFGGALFLGVAACFLTSVIILPGILGFIERQRKKST